MVRPHAGVNDRFTAVTVPPSVGDPPGRLLGTDEQKSSKCSAPGNPPYGQGPARPCRAADWKSTATSGKQVRRHRPLPTVSVSR